MAAERLLRILSLLAERDGSSVPRLCDVAVEVTAVSGAGVMLFADGRPQASLCSTDDVSLLIEEAQYTLGEGPCVDAHRLGQVISEPDLGGANCARWAAFSREAFDAGARAVFGYPIRLGAARLGALNLYRDQPGALSDDQHIDALVMADVAARAILTAQAEAASDHLGAGLDGDMNLWAIVHQAAGMVSVQLAIPVSDALVRLRAHAFVTDRLVAHVALDVVERRLRLDIDE